MPPPHVACGGRGSSARDILYYSARIRQRKESAAKHGLSARRSAPPPARTPHAGPWERTGSACAVPLLAFAIRHWFPRQKGRHPLCLCLPANHACRPGALPLLGRHQPFPWTRHSAPDTHPAPSTARQESTAARRGRTVSARARSGTFALPRTTPSSSRLADRSNPTGFALVFRQAGSRGIIVLPRAYVDV